MQIDFLDLGKQPLANNVLSCRTGSDIEQEEYTYDCVVTYDTDTHLVSLREIPDSSLAFNGNYPYHSSSSKTMVEHFRETAEYLQRKFGPQRTLEIGSNDGIFARNFDPDSIILVEPCKNFADYTESLGYNTVCNPFNKGLPINYEQFDLIYAANSIPHIPNLDVVWEGIDRFLKPSGLFVMECPSLVSIIKSLTYDQWYNEHPHTFSVLALKKLLEPYGLYVRYVEGISVHGNSMRVYIGKNPDWLYTGERYPNIESDEDIYELYNEDTYYKFAEQIIKLKYRTLSLLERLKYRKKKVVAYGATAKSATIFNYCGIDTDLVSCIMDTTPAKQNTLSPGAHIPIVPYQKDLYGADVLLMTAWNYGREIMEKEKDFEGDFMMLPVPRMYKTGEI